MEAQTVDVEEIIRQYLPNIVHLSLATVRENRPWVCEVHYAYDDDLNLYFRSLASRRHSQEIAANPQVAGTIVKQHALSETQVLGVYFEGTAKLLESGEEQQAAFECIQRILHADESILGEAAREDGHKFYKISVQNWYVFGRFGAESSTKHKLEWNGGPS